MILIINSAGIYDESNKIAKYARELPNSSAVIVGGLRKQGYPVVHKDLRNLVSPFLPQQLAANDFFEFLKSGRKTPLMEDYLSHSLEVLPNLEDVKLIGISVFSHVNYLYTLALAKEINQRFPQIPICLGGPFVTIRELEIEPYIRFVIKGNGTGPIRHLAAHFLNNSPLDENFPGFWRNSNGKTTGNGINQEPADMEELPDFSDLNLDSYLFDLPSGKKQLKIPYRTSLGCANRCSFCTGRLVDSKLRFKSVEKTVREIKALNSLHENVMIRFTDASINNEPGIISEIMDSFIRENYRFPWRAFAKMNHMTDELLEKFAQTGCESLIWGIEHASPHMIEVFNKKYDIQAAEKIIAKASSLEIENVIYFIFNGPGETDADVEINERFIKKWGSYPNVSFDLFNFYLEEGSLFYKHPERYGIEILERNQKDDYTVRENIRWKETGLSLEEFKAKQQRHYEKKMELLNYC